ncbi:hypothetical protein MKX03_032159 [Papaver bracteatum]|nr:hypothetical protein MKX03_032159 [Papaver bracteatum]
MLTNPRINSALAVAIRMRKVARNSSSMEGPAKLYHVVQNHRFDDMDNIFASPADFQALESRDRKIGLHLLEHFISCEAWIKSGDAKEVIFHEVGRVRPDLLVVGCRGLGPFQRVFVGTVSKFCQKHAECPIITIKRKEEDMPQDPVDD